MLKKYTFKEIIPYLLFFICLLVGGGLFINNMSLRNQVAKLEKDKNGFEAERKMWNSNIDSLISEYNALEINDQRLKVSISESEHQYSSLKDEYNKYRNAPSKSVKSFTIRELDSFWSTKAAIPVRVINTSDSTVCFSIKSERGIVYEIVKGESASRQLQLANTLIDSCESINTKKDKRIDNLQAENDNLSLQILDKDKLTASYKKEAEIEKKANKKLARRRDAWKITSGALASLTAFILIFK